MAIHCSESNIIAQRPQLHYRLHLTYNLVYLTEISLVHMFFRPRILVTGIYKWIWEVLHTYPSRIPISSFSWRTRTSESPGPMLLQKSGTECNAYPWWKGSLVYLRLSTQSWLVSTCLTPLLFRHLNLLYSAATSLHVYSLRGWFQTSPLPSPDDCLLVGGSMGHAS